MLRKQMQRLINKKILCLTFHLIKIWPEKVNCILKLGLKVYFKLKATLLADLVYFLFSRNRNRIYFTLRAVLLPTTPSSSSFPCSPRHYHHHHHHCHHQKKVTKSNQTTYYQLQQVQGQNHHTNRKYNHLLVVL